MRCDFCQGSGLSVSLKFGVPCRECGGFGILQPCEGLRAQPMPKIRNPISEFDMSQMLDWATRSNQRLSRHFIRYLEGEDELIGWNVIADLHTCQIADPSSNQIK